MADSNTLTVVLNKLHGDVLLISITKKPQVHTTVLRFHYSALHCAVLGTQRTLQ